MSVMLLDNGLLNCLMIVFFYKSNGFFIANLIDHRVLFDLEKFQRYENNYNSHKIKYKGWNLKDETLSKACFSKKKKISYLIKQGWDYIYLAFPKPKFKYNYSHVLILLPLFFT